MGSHTGTHVDAFSHMHKDGETLEEIPLERFFGKARLVFPQPAAASQDGAYLQRRSGSGPPRGHPCRSTPPLSAGQSPQSLNGPC